MTDFATILRPYWAPGINNVKVNKSRNIKDWILEGKHYQIYNQITNDSFTLDVTDRTIFLKPISQDCNKFICAALESLIKTESELVLTRSISWAMIKQYYSAFYAAHTILRYFGISLTQMDSSHINKIQGIADLFSTRNNVNVESGYYKILYNNTNKNISFQKINVRSDGGTHIVLWKIFAEQLDRITDSILAESSNTSIQKFIIKLIHLKENLSYIGSNNYSWLSRTRNEINYKFLHGTWFPYKLNDAKAKEILRNSNNWRGPIINIELKNLVGNELVRFSNTCQFITGLCLEIGNDMSKRCTEGKSFLLNGHVKLINIS